MHERQERRAGGNQPHASKPPEECGPKARRREYKHHRSGGVTDDRGIAIYTQKMQAGGHDHRPERQDAAASETSDQRSSAERPGIS